MTTTMETEATGETITDDERCWPNAENPLRARLASMKSKRPTCGRDDAHTRFTTVEIKVTAEYSDREQFEKLVEIADRGCIMMNTLRGKLDIKVRIAALV